MANSFFGYPPGFPITEFTYLLGMIRQQQLALPDSVHAGWVCCGWALSQAFPDNTPAPAPHALALAAPAPGFDLEHTVTSLIHLHGETDSEVHLMQAAAISIDWKSLAISIAQLLLSRLLGAA